MRRFLMMLVLGVLCLVSSQTSFSADAVSKYVWRGGAIVDGFSLQPAVDIELSFLNLNVWASFGLSERDVNKLSDEIDYTLTYGLDLKAVEANIGIIYYQLPNFSDGNTVEVFGDASFSLGVLGASAAFYYDIDATEDFYVNFGVNHSMGLFNLASSLGYNNSASEISDVNFTLERSLKLASIEAGVYASFVISPLYDDNTLYFGAHFGF